MGTMYTFRGERSDSKPLCLMLPTYNQQVYVSNTLDGIMRNQVSASSLLLIFMHKVS